MKWSSALRSYNNMLVMYHVVLAMLSIIVVLLAPLPKLCTGLRLIGLNVFVYDFSFV